MVKTIQYFIDHPDKLNPWRKSVDYISAGTMTFKMAYNSKMQRTLLVDIHFSYEKFSVAVIGNRMHITFFYKTTNINSLNRSITIDIPRFGIFTEEYLFQQSLIHNIEDSITSEILNKVLELYCVCKGTSPNDY